MAIYAIKDNKCLAAIALARGEETDTQRAIQSAETELTFIYSFGTAVLSAAGCKVNAVKAEDSSTYTGDVYLKSLYPSDAGGDPTASNPTCVTAIVTAASPSVNLDVSCIISALVQS